MMDQFVISSEDQAVARLLNDAEALLHQMADAPPAAFLQHLFGHVIPEDLFPYQPRDLVRLTADAWQFFQKHRSGTPNIRMTSPDAPAGSALAGVSILEIVNDDMPFLVDSVLAELTEQGVEAFVVCHPLLSVERAADGSLKQWDLAKLGSQQTRESLMHFHVSRIEDEVRRDAIIAALKDVLADVRLCVRDWPQMVRRIAVTTEELRESPPPLPEEEVAEAIQFLEWLAADNFTFLGVRDYAIVPEHGGALEPKLETGLGLLRERDARVLRRKRDQLAVTPEVYTFLKEPKALIVTKSALRSRVHRRVYMDYVGVKHFDAAGALVGETRLVGLFTSTAYTRSTSSIPYLRRKVAGVLARAGYSPDSHRGKALANVLENYPRDELFQVDDETLYQFATAIMQLDGRPRVRVLPRHDEFKRFTSVMVFVPRDRYDSAARLAIGDYLAKVYRGHVSAYFPFFPEGPNVRVHYIIGHRDPEVPHHDRSELETAVEDIVRSWSDGFVQALHAIHDPVKARALMERYRSSFSATYRGAYSPQTAVNDLRIIETLSADRPRGADFYHRAPDGSAVVGLKVWSLGEPIALTERVPVLENMGFRVVDERTHEIAGAKESDPPIWFHDMTLERADHGDGTVPDALKASLEDCFLAVMRGDAENDGYNALVLGAGLGWREVSLIRAISRYLRQVAVPFSQDYMWATLCHHAGIAAKLVELFYARFDPRSEAEPRSRADREAAIVAELMASLDSVESLDEDRILRRFINAVTSALRTNFFQPNSSGRPGTVISLKFDSHAIEALPSPRPLYEIFVYSPRVEGIHLRFGKVARGGIRWSDRPQDFRTEVLGLVKAQQVKNAVIVPVGAKGGFVPKRLPRGGSREAIQQEGIAAYRIFISALLDLTDNVTASGIEPPRDVVRHDDDDPYLVVAADKGTASFSDIANGLAQDHSFWLDDAFASGGSAGYDHKEMGITARGAWESVKRHFREMDIDIHSAPFTVAGVGDMSGDVFGNGMLREATIKLVAAFDHRDIFIDPDPDPAKSFVERQRLFNLPRSSWQDYDKALISKGGGVYSRSLKHIELSAAAQAALGFARAVATPQEVMQSILTAPVDLLFFGGIGTYVRATDESDFAAGDRSNDFIRVTGAALRCKVIGEGANLGMTQRGRIEAAHGGVRLNTDAIDNSAGVNTSDLEVNIKIATAIPMQDGRMTRKMRNGLLVEMTDDVAALVLRNNYQQTLAISLARKRGMEDFGFQQRLMQILESRGLLDRAVEFLPDDMALSERRRQMQPLTRPELAVLLAYAKLALYAELLECAVPDDPYLGREILRYFPAQLAQAFPDALEHHRLRREIIATQLANSIINRGGPSLVVRLADQTGASSAAIAAAFATVRDSYSMTAFNTDIDLLDNRIKGETQLELYHKVQWLLLDRLVWFLRHVDFSSGLAGIIEHYRDGIAAVDAALTSALPKELAISRDSECDRLQEAGVPRDLAWRIANLSLLVSAPDITLVATRAGKPVPDVASTFFAVNAFFQLDSITASARTIAVADYFDRLALDRSLDAIGDAQRRITATISGGELSGNDGIRYWASKRSDQVDRIRASIHEVASTGLTLSKLSVAASLLGDLAGA